MKAAQPPPVLGLASMHRSHDRLGPDAACISDLGLGGAAATDLAAMAGADRRELIAASVMALAAPSAELRVCVMERNMPDRAPRAARSAATAQSPATPACCGAKNRISWSAVGPGFATMPQWPPPGTSRTRASGTCSAT
jgi:hypothetical protein